MKVHKYAAQKKKPLLMIISAAWILAFIVEQMTSPTSPLNHVARFAWSLLFGVAIVVQGVIYRRQSPDWIEVRGVLHKRPFAKWSANVIIAVGVLMLCLVLLLQAPLLLRFLR